MAFASESWSTQQLAEFLSLVSSFTEERDAVRSGVERVAEAINTEVAALVRDGRVDASIGFPAGVEPVDELIAVAAEPKFERELGDLGICTGMSCPVGEDGAILLAARVGRDGFSQEEIGLLRGWAASWACRCGASSSSPSSRSGRPCSSA
jgi:hypothetical protein